MEGKGTRRRNREILAKSASASQTLQRAECLNALHSKKYEDTSYIETFNACTHCYSSPSLSFTSFELSHHRLFFGVTFSLLETVKGKIPIPNKLPMGAYFVLNHPSCVD
jgi:hypothetical protein